MSLSSLIVRAAVPLPKLEQYQRFLFLGPHPDDIEIGAGATAAKLVSLGKEVCFTVCTDGRFGLGNAPRGATPETLISLRQEEARSSASMLGVQDLRFLSFSDGGLYEKQDLVRAIAGIIADFQPEVIFAPDPDVTSECHADHLNVGRAAKQLACFAPYPELMNAYGAAGAPVKALALYMTAKANRCVDTKGCLSRQLDAIFRCHLSQFPDKSDEAKALRLYLRIRSADYGLRCFSSAGEGFRVLGPTHMHCLPEAGT